MGNDWKEDLASIFEGFLIIASSKEETLVQFGQFCDFIAEPAFESLKEELKLYKIRTKINNSEGKSISLQVNFPRSRIDNFQYTLSLPRNSVELKLNLQIKGRASVKNPPVEKAEEFMENIMPSEVLKLKTEDIIKDVIKHYRNFNFEAFTKTDE